MADSSNTPHADSNRTLAGGTPQFDAFVSIRVRARTLEAAHERIARWTSELEQNGSIESVEVEGVYAVTGLDQYEVCPDCKAVCWGNAMCATCRSHWPGGDPLVNKEGGTDGTTEDVAAG